MKIIKHFFSLYFHYEELRGKINSISFQKIQADLFTDRKQQFLKNNPLIIYTSGQELAWRQYY